MEASSQSSISSQAGGLAEVCWMQADKDRSDPAGLGHLPTAVESAASCTPVEHSCWPGNVMLMAREPEAPAGLAFASESPAGGEEVSQEPVRQHSRRRLQRCLQCARMSCVGPTMMGEKSITWKKAPSKRAQSFVQSGPGRGQHRKEPHHHHHACAVC